MSIIIGHTVIYFIMWEGGGYSVLSLKDSLGRRYSFFNKNYVFVSMEVFIPNMGKPSQS